MHQYLINVMRKPYTRYDHIYDGKPDTGIEGKGREGMQFSYMRVPHSMIIEVKKRAYSAPDGSPSSIRLLTLLATAPSPVSIQHIRYLLQDPPSADISNIITHNP